jgi:hypothetical protein
MDGTEQKMERESQIRSQNRKDGWAREGREGRELLPEKEIVRKAAIKAISIGY